MSKISIALDEEDWHIVIDSLEFKKLLSEAMIVFDKSTSDYEAEMLKSDISVVQGVFDKISSELNVTSED